MPKLMTYPARSALRLSRGGVVKEYIPGSGSQDADFTVAFSGVHRQAPTVGGVAPLPVFIDIAATGFDVEHPIHDLDYVTTWGDPGEHRHLDPSMPWGRSHDKSYGWMAGHVYEAAGNYTITITVRARGGASVTKQFTVVVDAIDGVYDPAQTLVIAADGDFSGAPVAVPAANQLTDWQQMSWDYFRHEQSPRRVLLKRGGSYVNAFDREMTGGAVLVDAWGDPEAPPPTIGGYGLTIKHKPWFAARDVDLVGDYDPVFGTYGGTYGHYPDSGLAMLNAATSERTPCALLRTRVRNKKAGLSIGTVSGGTVAQDCVISDWLDIGAYPDGLRQAYVGCTIAQHPRAFNGGTDKNEAPSGEESVRHGPVRITLDASYIVADNCDLFSFGSWNEGGHQPCFRGGSGPIADFKVLASRLRAEAGALFGDIGGTQNSGTPAAYGDGVVDGLYFFGAPISAFFMSVRTGAISIRNTISVRPSVADEPKIAEDGSVMLDGSGNPDTNSWSEDGVLRWEAYPVDDPVGQQQRKRVHNNTTVDLRSGKTHTLKMTNDVPSEFTDARAANNVVHAPNFATPQDAGPLDTSQSLMTPRYAGQWTGKDQINADYATDGAEACDYAPLAGSAALGTAEGEDIAFRDFYMRVRPSTGASKGAVDPNAFED